MSELERDVEEALRRAQADRLGAAGQRRASAAHGCTWGHFAFLKPATPWHLVGVGVLLVLASALLPRLPLLQPLGLLGALLVAAGLLALILLPRPAPPRRWRDRVIVLDESRCARLYRCLFRR